MRGRAGQGDNKTLPRGGTAWELSCGLKLRARFQQETSKGLSARIADVLSQGWTKVIIITSENEIHPLAKNVCCRVCAAGHMTGCPSVARTWTPLTLQTANLRVKTNGLRSTCNLREQDQGTTHTFALLFSALIAIAAGTAAITSMTDACLDRLGDAADGASLCDGDTLSASMSSGWPLNPT